ncbi:MAG: hypothetical protein ACK5XZ_11485 [Hyphomonadaceae bacterium]|jgi:hypothetical protein|uniref:hypothetical protein n=1 Tax=Aquidulcibacter sp. TaxID=2052990 RepID=UPI0022CC67DB|nr:hypothetical protein [Aquidulcibacter sp.]MCZ8210172.1 hypothetical protein [Aquidulcibacter sp.]
MPDEWMFAAAMIVFWAVVCVVVFVVGVIILLDVSTLLKLKIKQNQVKLNAMIKDQKS